MSAQPISMEGLSKKFATLQNDLTDLVRARQKLETQYQENKIVKQEFDTLKEDAKIYKLVGPVLLPQDTHEANLNVDKRIEFITDEIKRVEEKIQKCQSETELARDQLVSARTAAVGPPQ